MAKRFGFTLAEVLITLGIIGIVASMTIPTLMNSTNQAEFRTGFKKIISTLNQAITTNVAMDSADFSNLTTGLTSGSLYYMFTQRMNVVNTSTAVDANLDPTGVGVSVSSTGNYTLYFNDGMVFAFATSATGCKNAVITGWCDAIVDVNGAKKPNKLTNCKGGTNGANPSAEASTDACSSATLTTGDRFSIRFGGQQVIPNGPGARYTLYN